MIVLAVVIVSTRAVGQELPADVKTSSKPAEVTIQALPPGYHLIQKDAATREITIHQNVAPQILKDVQNRHLNQTRIQPFELQKLEISGNIEGKLARLSAELLVLVEQDDEWVHVPVGFDSFNLTNLSHSSTAKNGAGRFEQSQLPKKNWLLFGKGEHTILLEMVGQIKSTSNQRNRLQLSAPEATLSHLSLKCPQAVEAVELSSGKPFHLRVDNKSNSSEIETWGLQADVELSWLPRPVSKNETIMVQSVGSTKMSLDLTTALMTVRQPLSISGGSLSELKVSIPDDFAVASIRATDSEGRNVVNAAAQEGITDGVIRFSSSITGAVALEYDLSLKNTNYPQKISVQVPNLADLANETADLEISVPVGLEVEVTRPDEHNTRQQRVESTGGQRSAMVAYRLLSSAAKVELAISETEAFYSINPVVSLETERNTILLTSRFSVNMVRGSLNEMEVKWPGFRQEGWTILDVQMQLPDEDTKIPIKRSDSDDAFRVTFPRLSGKFEIEMQAARDLTSFVEGNHLMFLPNIQGPTPHTTTVSLIESDAFSMTLAARNGQAPFPSLPASRLPKDLQIRKSALSAWSVDTTDEAVTVKITPQQPEVRAGVLAELSVATNNIHVSEVISYEVLHRDLSEIRLKTDGVTPTVRLDGTGDALVGTASNSGVVTYALPESLRGTFRVLVDFYWSPRLTSDTNLGSTIALPIVLPNAPDQLNDITIATNAPRSLSIERNEAWTRIHSDEFAAAWLTKTQPTSIPITLQHSLKSRVENKPNFLVLKSVTHGTKLVTSMTAVFGEPADAVLFSISNACTVNEGYMGAQRVSVEPVVKGKDRTTIQLRQPDMSTGTSPITATLIVEQTFTLQNSLFSACKPEVPRILGQDEHCNAIWIIAENPDNSLLHTGDSMVEITSSTALKMTRDKSNTPISGAAALVAPYDRKTREAVLELLDETLQSTNQYSLLAGTVQGKNRLMISVPRRSVLLVTAILGILIYFAILRFRAVSILTTLAILTAAVTVIIAVAPNPGSVILQRLTPGCVLALIAASLQRFFTPAHAATPMALNTTDHSTIFTVDQPINTSLPTDSQLAPTAMMTPP